MRRQTATSGINPVGSSRLPQLDPLSLPVSFEADDIYADGGVRQIELYRERVVMRRALRGMRISVGMRVCDFLGVARRAVADAWVLVLVHRDPCLTIPLGESSDPDGIASAWQSWSEIFALPQLLENAGCEPAPRRRRHHTIAARRPKFLLRRRGGERLDAPAVHQGEHEIIAPD